MRLATLADASAIEEVVERPAALYLAAPNFVVVGDEGFFLAFCIGPGRYEVHTQMRPECRGAKALRAAREALQVAFLETDCVELVSLCPANMPHTLWFAKAMGMRVSFVRPHAWPFAGRLWDLTFVEMGVDDWIRTGACAPAGRWFHQALGAHQDHVEDAIHDAYVGAAVELIGRGRVTKGVALYNRFAVFAKYQTITVLSEQPLRIDMRTHVLRVEEGTFNVEACHA